MKYNEIVRKAVELANACENLPADQKRELGEKAFELIGEYPLYVNGCSNITYGNAIIIALTTFGEIDRAIVEKAQADRMADEYFKYVKESKAKGEPALGWGEWEQKIYKGGIVNG